MAYERVHGPIDNRRGDYQAALIARFLAAAFRGKGAVTPPFKDFLLEFDKADQSEEQMRAVMQQLASTVEP